MRRTWLILLLAVLTGCGRSAVTSAPSPSPSITDSGPSESAEPDATFTPLPRPTHPARPSTPPATFVAIVESGDIVVAETATGQIVRTVVARNESQPDRRRPSAPTDAGLPSRAGSNADPGSRLCG